MWLRFFVFSTMIRSTDIRNSTRVTICRRSNVILAVETNGMTLLKRFSQERCSAACRVNWG